MYMLQLLQPSDTARLREPLRRNQQLLLDLVAKHSTSATTAAAGADDNTVRQQPAEQLHRDAPPAAATAAAGMDSGQEHGSRSAGSAAYAEGGQGRQQPSLPLDPFGQEAPQPSSRQAGDVRVMPSSSTSRPVPAGLISSDCCRGVDDVPAAVLGLCRVLGPTLLQAWEKQSH